MGERLGKGKGEGRRIRKRYMRGEKDLEKVQERGEGLGKGTGEGRRIRKRYRRGEKDLEKVKENWACLFLNGWSN